MDHIWCKIATFTVLFLCNFEHLLEQGIHSQSLIFSHYTIHCKYIYVWIAHMSRIVKENRKWSLTVIRNKSSRKYMYGHRPHKHTYTNQRNFICISIYLPGALLYDCNSYCLRSYFYPNYWEGHTREKRVLLFLRYKAVGIMTYNSFFVKCIYLEQYNLYVWYTNTKGTPYQIVNSIGKKHI